MVRSEARGKISAKASIKIRVEKIQTACDVWNRVLNRRKRQRKVNCLNRWRMLALFGVTKEAIEQG